jgi:hypothetical protein
MTRGRVVLREEDPHYRALIKGLLAAVGVPVDDAGDVLVASGSPSDSGRFRSFVRIEHPLAPMRLLSDVEAAL